MANKTSTGMSKLLANASKMEKEIKETENVASTTNVESEKPEEKQEQETIEEVNILSEKKDKENVEDKEKNKGVNRKEEYNLLFQERKIKDVEMIRISQETHAKLKRLSNVSGVSMHVLASNILELTFDKYNKEIQAAIKKYMNL